MTAKGSSWASTVLAHRRPARNRGEPVVGRRSASISLYKDGGRRDRRISLEIALECQNHFRYFRIFRDLFGPTGAPAGARAAG